MLRKTILSAFALLCFAGKAAAAPIVLPEGIPLYFQFGNLEDVSATNSLVVPGYTGGPAGLPTGVTTSSTQGNYGVFNVSSMQFGGILIPHTDISGGAAFFSDDGPGGTQGMITGIFYGIQVTGPTTATGGYIDLYWHDPGADTTLGTTAAAESSCLAGVTCSDNAAGVAAFTTGTFLARLDFASGIQPANPVTTIASTCDPTTITSGTCNADSFANVDLSAGGAWAAALNGDWFNTNFGTRDLRFSNIFFVTAGNNWDLKSNDPGRSFTATSSVPEPATLTLLGVGLAGFAARRRKKAKQA